MSIASRGQKRGFVTKFNLAASLLTRIKIYMTLHLGFSLQHSIPSGLHHPLSSISLLHSHLFGNGAIAHFDTPFTIFDTVGDAARSVSTIPATAPQGAGSAAGMTALFASPLRNPRPDVAVRRVVRSRLIRRPSGQRWARPKFILFEDGRLWPASL